MPSKYEPVIGLEVHIELATKSKMFCACPADYFGAKPNTHTCPICLGLPGALPKANAVAIEYAQKLGLALHCQSLLSSKFDRKHYFYPDLPKGFQISQYDLPFSQKGYLEIEEDGKEKKIEITRAHLEEDTGKLAHATVDGRRVTLVDFNRSGVPLIEIVSEPQMTSSSQAKNYAQKLQLITRHLGVSQADMEKGSMRIEPNVSLKIKGQAELPPYKVELKNINSFKFAESAIEFEIARQTELLASRKVPTQETRGWNEFKKITFSQRTKELAHDYRYFPEPDLPPHLFKKSNLEALKKGLPELPDQKLKRLIKNYSLTLYEANLLTRDRNVSDFFEEAVKVGAKASVSPKTIANYLINKKPPIEEMLPAQLVKGIQAQSRKFTAKKDEIKKIIENVIATNQKAVSDYQKGKQNSLMFLVGQVVKLSNGKADPKEVIAKITDSLEKT